MNSNIFLLRFLYLSIFFIIIKRGIIIFCKILNKIRGLEPLFPLCYSLCGEKILKDKYDELNERRANINVEDSKNEFFDIIYSHYKQEDERRNLIENKAKSIIFIITLSLTFILSSLNFIYSPYMPKSWFLLLILVLGVIYLVSAGLGAIKALSIQGYNELLLDNMVTGEYESLNVKNFDISEKINIFYECTKLNQILTNIKANFIDSTFSCIRNAIILITSFFVLLIFNKMGLSIEHFISSIFTLFNNLISFSFLQYLILFFAF